jgi:RNA polymerase sigma factor (sigma-70 family)
MPMPASPRPSDSDLSSLLAEVRPRITRLFRSFRVPPPEAEDLLQDALLALVLSWTSIAEPKAWLVTTLRYLCYGYLRRERYGQRASAVDPEVLEALVRTPPDAPERMDLELDVAKLARVLPPRQRQLLRLRYVAGMSYEEASNCLGYRRGSVQGCLQRSIRLLKERGGL